MAGFDSILILVGIRQSVQNWLRELPAEFVEQGHFLVCEGCQRTPGVQVKHSTANLNILRWTAIERIPHEKDHFNPRFLAPARKPMMIPPHVRGSHGLSNRIR